MWELFIREYKYRFTGLILITLLSTRLSYIMRCLPATERRLP
jgi:hypothetical protein